MGSLTAWRFDTAIGADTAHHTLETLAKQRLITVHDAATVSWPLGAKKPKTKELHDLVAAGALGGMFWGLLFGMLFFAPLLGAAVGFASGAIGGLFRDVGIDDVFIRAIREQVTPGTSALFLLTSDAVLDRVRPALAPLNPQLISSNLSDEQEQTLRDVFSGSDATLDAADAPAR